jgi:CBS domain-containing protein
MQVKDIMSSNIQWVTPEATIDEVAQKMRGSDAGAVLVGNENQMMGIITDHDIATKVIADGREAHEVKANDIMNTPLLYCYDDQEAEDVADNMIQQHALRMLVVDHNKRARGVVAHSDLADAVVKNGLYYDPLAQKVVQLASKIAS